MLSALVVLVTVVWASAYDLRGPDPVNFCKRSTSFTPCKSDVNLYVNRLNSEESLIPYEFQHFGFCPIDATSSPHENLGQVVFGERIRPGPYKIEFLEDVKCAKACTRSYVGGDQDSERRLQTLKKGISLNYQHHWIVDDMPVTWSYVENDWEYCTTSFPMGCLVHGGMESCPFNVNYNKSDTYYPFNHVDLTITYISRHADNWRVESIDHIGRIVAIKVIPRSIDHHEHPDCNNRNPLEIPTGPLLPGQRLNITYTYSVRFERNPYIKWSSRWDYILDSLSPTNTHLFSILNSLVIVLLLAGMVAFVMLRALHKEAQSESGWKLVHGDVFRPPRNGMLLSALLGSGVQVIGMVVGVLALACLELFPPSNGGAMMSSAMGFYALMGTAAGYVSTRVYKSFGGNKWMSNVLLTSILSPGIVFALFYAMDLVLWKEGSSGAVPFCTLMSVLAMWFCVLMPLTLVGGYFGFQNKTIEYPVQVNQDPRPIPNQPIYTWPIVGIAVGGVIPFGRIFIHLFFILNSIWSNQLYNMFGMLFVVFIILAITCSETAILLCYLHLRAQDYHWWWRSFLTSGFTAVYMLLYCVHYFVTRLSIADAASTLLYFGYTTIMVFLFFLLTGTIGFAACFWFTRRIYGAVKVDTIMKG